MPKKTNKSSKDTEDRMIDEYFKHLESYRKKYGEKTLLLWQCGGFFEVYGRKDESTNEFIDKCFTDYLDLMAVDPANKVTYICQNGKNYRVCMHGYGANDYQKERIIKIMKRNNYTIAHWHEVGKDSRGRKIRVEEGIYSPSCVFDVEGHIDSNTAACYVINTTKPTNKKDPTIYFGCSTIDMCTGKITLFEHIIQKPNVHNTTVFNELERFNSVHNPSETIIIHNYDDESKFNDVIQFADLHTNTIHNINQNSDEEYSIMANKCDDETYKKDMFHKFFKNIKDYNFFLETTTLSQHFFAAKSICFLLEWVWCHNANLTNKVQIPVFETTNNTLYLGNHSLQQLNIVNNGKKKGTFSSIETLINKCVTPMGRRYLKDKILHPVTDVEYLNEQYSMIEHIINNWEKFTKYRNMLKTIKDIEHLYRKIIFNKITPYNLATFNANLHTILEIHSAMEVDKTMNDYIIKNIGTNIREASNTLINKLESFLDIEICSQLISNDYTTNFIKRNVSTGLDDASDELDEIILTKLNWIKTLKSLITDRKLRGLKDSIKFRITDTGAYFATQVSRCKDIQKNIKLLKPTYKKNELDFSTYKYTSGGYGGTYKLGGTILKQFYNKYIQKQSNMTELLETQYTQFVISLKNFDTAIYDVVKYIRDLDMLISKAYISMKYNYCKPTIDNTAEKSFLEAKDLRHPLIEQIQTDEIYTPNDITIGKNKNGLLIYGTNGVGKSSITRSVGIAIIMAQSGMFVPCTNFIFKPYNAIYTRILGNDNIFKGLSTFTVEMSEVSTFLNNCDENCLILGDEVCSGTETDSACAIFQAVLMRLNKSKTSHIFATHFHQLTNRKEVISLKDLDIKHMSVQNKNGVLYYTRKLEDGPGLNMYGIEVCRAFDFPEGFVKEAEQIRNKYNKKSQSTLSKKKSRYHSKKLKGNCEWCDRTGIDIHHLEPQEKADINNWIKTFHKNHPANLANVCKECHSKWTKEGIVHKRVKTTEGYKLVEQ